MTRSLVLAVLLVSLRPAPAQAQPVVGVTMSSGGWVLMGDYTHPEGAGRVPAVLLLNGASRDRRAYIPLARELARRGLASLRLDLRGEGQSTNLGRFEPGSESVDLADSHEDVAVALAWLRTQSGIDGTRIGVLGASYSAEAAARAARNGSRAAAYVALSPGDFTDESAKAIDASGIPWWFIASLDERFAHTTVRAVAAVSRTAQTTFVEGTSHASDLLSPHYFLNHEIADWFAARLAGRSAPELWGALQPGPYPVGFSRRSLDQADRTLLLDLWYPAQADGKPMRFRQYLELSTDIRGAADGFPAAAGSVERTLAAAITGDPAGIGAETVDRLLDSPMAAGRDAPPRSGRFPLVIWTPRYATTVAQSVLSEYLASRGFAVAFVRPAQGGKLPFELPMSEARLAELRDRVADMRAAIEHFESEPHVNTTRIGVIAWSYTGEMATGLQLVEPRVALVAGLSTTLLTDWVFQPPAALAGLDVSRLTAAYAVLTQRGEVTGAPPAALNHAGASYFIEFPGLAHGSFNALEGYIPSRLGIRSVQRWSKSTEAGIAGYEAVTVILLRLLRQHVEAASPAPVARLPLTTGIPPGVAEVRALSPNGLPR